MNVDKSYDHWASHYDSNKNPTRDLDKRATIETLSKYEFGSVLELGCGTGKNTEWLITRADRIVGLDFSEGMLEEARKKINSAKVVFQLSDINRNWNLNDNDFDLVTCSLTLEHIQNVETIFSQVFKKLRPGGIFFVCELHPEKQYAGSKARFETEKGIHVLEVYTHHTSDFLDCAEKTGFQLEEAMDWYDENDKENIPRLISFVFKKS